MAILRLANEQLELVAMTDGDGNKNFRLGTWLVQPDLNRLSDGKQTVTLELRMMGVLNCLASRPGKIVGAHELLETVWHGRAHADDTIYQAIAHLRKSLGDDAHQPRYIETIPKKGYRLICPVTPAAAHSEMREFALHAPNGRRPRRRNLAIFAGVASIAVAIVLTVKPELWGRLSPTDYGPSDRSVAVLPFVDMSEDGSQQFLSDGVSEELIHVLSNLPDLRVTARTSSFAFRDSNEDIRQIGNKLNVATILEGSVRRDGNRIRVTSQLVDTSNGYHLWSQSFDRESSDIFGIQYEIAVAVAQIFEFPELDTLVTDERAAQGDDLQAYELYLLGMHHLHKETSAGYMLAIEYFERAIEADPSFGRAYAGLSESYADQYWFTGNQDLLKKAESAVDYALRLNDQSSDVRRALGIIKYANGDLSGAQAEFSKAIALNPNDSQTLTWFLGWLSSEDGEDEAAVMLQKALDLNPMSGHLNARMGDYVRWTDGDLDAAFIFYKRAMERDPDQYHAYGSVARYYQSIGRLDQAIPYSRKMVNLSAGPETIGYGAGNLASLYVDIGDYESAAKMIRRIRALEPDNPAATNSEIHLLLARGDFSAARDIVHRWLSKSLSNNVHASLIAFYEMVIGDTDHAEEIYTHLATGSEITGHFGRVALYMENELSWGMMGAVNLAHLHSRNGDTLAAQELLRKAREYMKSMQDDPVFSNSIFYVLAQIAEIEGNHDAAMDYFREAVEAGWTRAWFGRIDPIMVDLRKDERFMQILEELEAKLLAMREHPKILASSEP